MVFLHVFQDLIRSGAVIGTCNKKGQTPLDVCQPQARNAVAGSLVINFVANFLNGYFLEFQQFQFILEI